MTPEEARMLAVVGRELYMATITNPAPDMKQLGDRMRHPRPGDLVLEVSGIGRDWDPDQLGRLIRIEGEFPDDRYIVAPLHDPEREQGWRNSTFIALPTDRASRWLKEASEI